MISTTSVNHNITTFPREHGEKGNWNYEFTRHLSLASRHTRFQGLFSTGVDGKKRGRDGCGNNGNFANCHGDGGARARHRDPIRIRSSSISLDSSKQITRIHQMIEVGRRRQAKATSGRLVYVVIGSTRGQGVCVCVCCALS